MASYGSNFEFRASPGITAAGDMDFMTVMEHPTTMVLSEGGTR